LTYSVYRRIIDRHRQRRATLGREVPMNIGRRRRTTYIEPIDDPATAPVEEPSSPVDPKPLSPVPEPEPEPEPTR
jgi:hypothetical protein